MSAIGTFLAYVFALFGFLTSLYGVFTLLVGVAMFFLLPVIPKITGQYKALSRFYLWLMAGVLGRAAFVISAHNDLLLKKMRFDDRSVETMSFDDTDKAFEDPDQARHYFYGIPFALADEVHGILFDPRHAAVGQEKARHERQDDMVVQATASERDMYGVKGWIRGVFDLDRDAHNMLDLSNVRQLVTGIERAEHPETVEEFVKLAREPYKSGTSMVRVGMIIVAMVGPFLGIGLMADQLGGPGGRTSSIGWVGSLLWLMISTSAITRDDLKRAAPVLLGVLALGGIVAGMIVFLGTVTTILAVITFLLGFAFVFMLIRGLGSLGFPEAAGRMLLKLGLLGYDKPVFKWTPEKYVFEEYADLNTDAEPYWYGIAGSLLGFTYEPGPKSFESAHIPNKDIDSRAEIMTDGGASTNIPAGHSRFPEQRRAVYGGFVPKSPADGKFYVDTGISFSAFTHAAVGIKSHRFLVRAKEKYGGDGGLPDKTFMYLVFGSGLISTVLGVGVFFLL
jgi:hypothetical protein